MIDVQTIATTSLGDRSYLAHDGRVAVVVDPQRDIDRVLALADELGVRITHVAETHIHNDYVTGGLELAERTGAAYLVDARDDVGFDRTPITEGDDIAVGSMRLRPLATPGHTHHHLSYALTETQASGSGAVTAVFTGGSMLYGTTGRTDLVSPDDTVELTHAQYHSVRRLVDELPGDAVVYPTHGFGSFCSATPPSGEASTVGDQRHGQPGADPGRAGLRRHPDRRARGLPRLLRADGPHQRRRPRAGRPVGAGAGRARRAARPPRGRHRRGAVGRRPARAHRVRRRAPGRLAELPARQPFVTYLGWLLPDDAELTLIGETSEQVADARRELVAHRHRPPRRRGHRPHRRPWPTAHRWPPIRSRTSPACSPVIPRRSTVRRRPHRERARRRRCRRVGAHPAARAARPAATRSPTARCGSTAGPATAPRSRPPCSPPNPAATAN